MKRVAAPMIGGLATSFLLELLVYRRVPAVEEAGSAAAHGIVIPRPKKNGLAPS